MQSERGAATAGSKTTTPVVRYHATRAGAPRLVGAWGPGAAVAGVDQVTARPYVDAALAVPAPALPARVVHLAESGATHPSPEALAKLLEAGLPKVPDELDPHFADIGPFYASAGAMRQLGGISKQALASRRDSGSVLAMRSGDGTWLSPAWQRDGDGTVHTVLRPVLRALRGLDGWAAGVWLVAEHPDLAGASPRQALREGADPGVVAALAANDMVALSA